MSVLTVIAPPLPFASLTLDAFGTSQSFNAAIRIVSGHLSAALENPDLVDTGHRESLQAALDQLENRTLPPAERRQALIDAVGHLAAYHEFICGDFNIDDLELPSEATPETVVTYKTHQFERFLSRHLDPDDKPQMSGGRRSQAVAAVSQGIIRHKALGTDSSGRLGKENKVLLFRARSLVNWLDQNDFLDQMSQDDLVTLGGKLTDVHVWQQKRANILIGGMTYAEAWQAEAYDIGRLLLSGYNAFHEAGGRQKAESVSSAPEEPALETKPSPERPHVATPPSTSKEQTQKLSNLHIRLSRQHEEITRWLEGQLRNLSLLQDKRLPINNREEQIREQIEAIQETLDYMRSFAVAVEATTCLHVDYLAALYEASYEIDKPTLVDREIHTFRLEQWEEQFSKITTGLKQQAAGAEFMIRRVKASLPQVKTAVVPNYSTWSSERLHASELRLTQIIGGMTRQRNDFRAQGRDADADALEAHIQGYERELAEVLAALTHEKTHETTPGGVNEEVAAGIGVNKAFSEVDIDEMQRILDQLEQLRARVALCRQNLDQARNGKAQINVSDAREKLRTAKEELETLQWHFEQRYSEQQTSDTTASSSNI